MAPVHREDRFREDHYFWNLTPEVPVYQHHDPISPTFLTNSLPRPKSPRVGYAPKYGYNSNYYEEATPRTYPPPTILAAEQFAQISPDRPSRPRDRHPYEPTIQKSPSSITSASARRHSRRSRSRGRSSSYNNHHHSNNNSSMMISTTEDTVRGCVRGTFSLGRSVTQCLLASADIYQTECTAMHHNRGDDSTFLKDKYDDEEDSINDDGEDEIVIHREEPVANVRKPDKGESFDQGLVGPPQIVNVAKDSDIQRKVSEPSWEEPDKEKTPKQSSHRQHPQDESDEQGFLSLLAVQNKERKEATAVRNEAAPKQALQADVTPTTDRVYSDLRQLRLDLFRNDARDSDRVVPETLYNKALKELNVQVESIRTLQDELKDAKADLASAKNDLSKSRDDSIQRHQASSASSEKFFRQRLEIEDKLRMEMKKSEDLLDRLAQLQQENTNLRTSLKSAKLEAVRKESRLSSRSSAVDDAPKALTLPALDEKAPQSSYLSTLVISLRAEIVDLKAQLAEARAARLSAEHAMGEAKATSSEAVKESALLKAQVSALMNDLEDMKQRNESEVKLLQSEIDNLKKSLSTSSTHIGIFKTRGDKLEEELSETQEEAIRLRKQVADFMHKLAAVKNDRSEAAKANDAEARKLREEVNVMKEKLILTNVEIVQQAAEHLKERQRMEDEFIRGRVTATTAAQREAPPDPEALSSTSLEDKTLEPGGISRVRKFISYMKT